MESGQALLSKIGTGMLRREGGEGSPWLILHKMSSRDTRSLYGAGLGYVVSGQLYCMY